MEERDAKKRSLIERVTKKVLGRMPRIRRVWERRGEGGKEVVLVEMEDEKDKAELLERHWELKQKWGIEVDEDLTMEKRMRWKILQKARVERKRERRVFIDNRRIWIKGREIFWEEEEGKWKEE